MHRVISFTASVILFSFVCFYSLSAICCAEEPQPASAEEMYYLDQIKDEPQQIDSYLGLAKWYLRYQQFDKAADILSKASTMVSNNAAVYAVYGDLYGFQQKTNDAISMYEKAVKLAPENGEYWYALGLLYRRQNQYPAAITAYLKAEPNLAKFGFEMNKFYSELADIYIKSGKADKAGELVEKLKKIAPQSGNTLVALGDIYASLNQYDKAVAYYEQAIQLNPEDNQITFRIFNTLRNNGKIKETITLTKNVIIKTNNPTQAISLWNQVSNSFYQGGSSADLVELYEAVCRIVTDESSRQNIRQNLINIGYQRLGELALIFETKYKKAPKNQNLVITLAEIYSRLNQSEKAVPLYENLRKIQPDNTQIMSQLAGLYLLQGNFDKAVAMQQQVVSANPDNPANYVTLAQIYFRLGKKDKAEETIVKLQEKFPQNQSALIALADLYKQNGQPEKAIATIKSAIAGSPDNLNLRQILIRYYLDTSHSAEAEQELESLLESAMKNKQENQLQQIYNTAFNLYARTNHIEKAVAVYQQVLQLFPQEGPRSNIQWSLINTCQQNNRIGQLIEVLKPKIKEKPDDTSLLLLLAEAYSRGNRYLESLPIYEKLYAAAPDNDNYASQLLNLYQQQNNWQKVAELSKKMIKKYPDQPWRYTNLIHSYTQMGNPELAQELIVDIKKRMGDNPQIWPILGQIYDSLNQPQEAINAYEKAVTASPGNTQYYLNLGKLYKQVGNDTAAIKSYQKVIELGARDWERNQTEKELISLYLRSRNLKQAVKEFESWVALSLNRDWQIQEALRPLTEELLRQNQTETAWRFITKYGSQQQTPARSKWEPLSFNYQLTELFRQSIALQNYLELEVKKGTPDRLVYVTLVSIYQDQNRGENRVGLAIPVLEQATKRFSNEPEPYVLLADIYAQQKQNDSAIATYQKALSIQTATGIIAVRPDEYQFNRYTTMQRLAELYLHTNQKGKAFSLVQELEKNPNPTGTGWRTIGSIYEQAKDYDKAIPAYLQAIEALPKDTQLHISLVNCYLQLGKSDEAEKEANKLADSATEPWGLQQAYRQLVQVYDKQQLYDKEIELYLKMVEVNPQNYSGGNLGNDLIYSNQNQSRWEGLSTALEKRVKQNPKDLNAISLLADLYRRLGKPAILQ